MTDQLLMTDGCWELRKISPDTKILHSYIAHDCLGNTYYWWHLANIAVICPGCDQYPPQDMMTVWKLHNFDYIQSGHTGHFDYIQENQSGNTGLNV